MTQERVKPNFPLEVVERFRSFTEWQDWNNKHPYAESQEYAETLLAQIRTDGITDPLTQNFFAADQILIRNTNYRETIRAGHLISRHRALLLVLKQIAARPDMDYLISRKAKIYAPEALTDFALYLRGLFPRFLGSEFAETDAEREAIYPILNEDIHELSFPDKVFDLLISNEVFEHLHNLDLALQESVRVINDRGVLISTFPFVFNSESSIVKAKLKDGMIEYLVKPEYHGNPMKPEEGALVFELPGWNIIGRAKEAGFKDAYMAFVASAKHGVLGSNYNGVFVFVATKKCPEIVRKSETMVKPLQKIKLNKLKLVTGIVGLPRSGTTVFTASISAHSKVAAIFEPWNAAKKDMPPVNLSLQEFINVFGVEEAKIEKTVLVVKETATQLKYLEGIDTLLATLTPDGPKGKLIWIFRDPLHVFLSEIQARKEWWGAANLQLSVELFENWAQRSLAAMHELVKMCQKHDTICVSYEAFVERPHEILFEIMKFLGLEFEEGQINYFEHLNRKDVCGDIGVATQPQEINVNSIKRRQEETENLLKVVGTSTLLVSIQRFSEFADRLAKQGTVLEYSSELNELNQLLSIKI
jgi:SAM-dependent methyltransferase